MAEDLFPTIEMMQPAFLTMHKRSTIKQLTKWILTRYIQPLPAICMLSVSTPKAAAAHHVKTNPQYSYFATDG